jgi:hypothetical protein
MVTMFLRTQISLCQQATTLRQPRVSRVPSIVVAQVLDKNGAESEAEQLTEKTRLTEAKKGEPEQLIENKGSRLGRIFY